MRHFLLLAHPRSGSTLLLRSLADHPNVKMFGELFNDEEDERQRAFAGRRRSGADLQAGSDASDYYKEGEDGAEFLRQRVLRNSSPDPNIKAIGFKLFYCQARENPYVKTVWEYLLTNPNIYVIHLQRRNLLESYFSLRVATITREWARPKGATPSDFTLEPFRLDPEQCARKFNAITAHREWVKTSWSRRPMLEITYEDDLRGKYEQTIRAIEDFLDLEHVPTEQRLEKQARRPPREAILNYAELKEYFRYTLHEEYFE